MDNEMVKFFDEIKVLSKEFALRNAKCEEMIVQVKYHPDTNVSAKVIAKYVDKIMELSTLGFHDFYIKRGSKKGGAQIGYKLPGYPGFWESIGIIPEVGFEGMREVAKSKIARMVKYEEEEEA